MNRIKEIRLQKKVSQKDLAEAIDITRQAISLYEKNLRTPSPKVWQALADFFGVSVDWLKGYGYSWKELVNLLNDGYDESFTYQHSRDLDNKIMDAIAEKTGIKLCRAWQIFKRNTGT